MEDNETLVFRKRKKDKKNKLPRIRIWLPSGTFIIYQATAELLKVEKGDALMFAFSKKKNCAYVFKEEPEQDNYHLGMEGVINYRFTNKDLMLYFIDFFGIKGDKSVYFNVKSTPNEKMMYEININH